MSQSNPNIHHQHICTGLLAHVDAGKTTCIESMLFNAGVIQKTGRVDHQDAFLDFDSLERQRGITIYSKQAGLTWNDVKINVIDTPGHADFSAEMERTLSVIDCAIVLISALDGVQSHTKTIWRCLETYKIPAIIFINKMDATHLTKEELLQNISTQLEQNIIDLQAPDWIEQFASCDEELMEQFFENESLSPTSMAKAVMDRKAFPVLFGSALKNEGIYALLNALVQYTLPQDYPSNFGARVFKVTRDDTSMPIVHLKITGGSLKAKEVIQDQKIDQIRIYQGRGFQSVQEAVAGEIVSVKGLKDVLPGDGLGFEQSFHKALLSPALYYELILPSGCDPILMMGYMRVLMMEDPALQVEFNEQTQSIAVHLMGAIQKDVLKKKIFEQSGFQVEFSTGKIVYKETIANPVMGYGHFEPLRHYAEVHVLLEPAPRNSGISFSSKVSRDVLSLNWQRLILSALADWKIPGILTHSPLTDVKITLVNGRAHQKHTSGGDFRQASHRAVRQGLMKAENVLLEPYFQFTIQTSSEHLSKILYLLETRKATVEIKELDSHNVQIVGQGPVRTLMNIQEDLAKSSKGSAHIEMETSGYQECTDSQEIIEQIGYQAELDRKNPCGSVFCSNGSGTIFDWYEVEDHLHIPIETAGASSSPTLNSSKVSQDELKRVFAQAGGANRNAKKQTMQKKKRTELSLEPTQVKDFKHLPTCLIVDGYNMIYSWSDLKEIARTSLFAAREELITRLVNYQGYKGWSMIIVFDGTKTQGSKGSTSKNGSSSIVYTSSGITADSFIEKKVHDLQGKFSCIAATSDNLIQNSVFSHGARRISARELESLVQSTNTLAFSALDNLKKKGSF